MPDQTAPDTVQPASAATPASTPAPSPAPAAEPRHPGLSTLLGALADTVEDEPEKKPKVAPPATPEKTTPAPAAAPVAPERQIKVNKKPAPQRPALPVEDPVPEAPRPAATPTPAPDDGKWREGLLDNEKDMLAEAEYAEKKFPDRHKGLLSKTEKFLREHAAMVENPDFNPDSPAYKTFLDKNKPVLAERDVREITESRVADRVRGEVSPELEELRHELFRREAEPVVEKRAAEIFSRLAKDALPEELMKAFNTAGGGNKGIEVLRTEYPMEFEIADNVIGLATSDLREFMRITETNPKTGKTLASVAKDQSDPRYEQHQRLGKMVEDLCNDFKATGGAELQRDGKWFVTRDEWNAIPAGKRQGFWTFKNEELIERGQRMVPRAVSEVIRLEREKMTKRGWTRATRPTTTPAAAAPAAVPPGPSAPHPAPRPSPTPAVSSNGNSAASPAARSLAGLLNQG